MEVRCIKIKLKKNSLREVHEWFSIMRERKNEVLETLKNENVFVESAFLDKINGDDYLVYYIKTKNLKIMGEIFSNSKLPIDDFYKKNWRNFCEEVTVLEPVLDCDLFT